MSFVARQLKDKAWCLSEARGRRRVFVHTLSTKYYIQTGLDKEQHVTFTYSQGQFINRHSKTVRFGNQYRR